jgi:hypothetical protein
VCSRRTPRGRGGWHVETERAVKARNHWSVADPPRQGPSREVVDHRVQVGAGSVEQADDGGVDVPHLVGSRRAKARLRLRGVDAEPGRRQPNFRTR